MSEQEAHKENLDSDISQGMSNNSSPASKFFFWLFFIAEIAAFIAGAGCTFIYMGYSQNSTRITSLIGIIMCLLALVLLVLGMIRARKKYKSTGAKDGLLILIGALIAALFVFAFGCAIGVK